MSKNVNKSSGKIKKNVKKKEFLAPNGNSESESLEKEKSNSNILPKEVKVEEDKPLLKRKKGSKGILKKKTKFEEYLEMGMHNSTHLLAEEDLEMERKLAKKLKVKDGGKLGGEDDGINFLFDSSGEEEELQQFFGKRSETKKQKKKKKKKSISLDQADHPIVETSSEPVETCDVHILEEVPDEDEASSRKKPKKRKLLEQEQEGEMVVDTAVVTSNPVQSCAAKEVPANAPAGKGNGKYIAPHLRARAGNESEEDIQIRRRARGMKSMLLKFIRLSFYFLSKFLIFTFVPGLLNRLSESNVESITREISNILHVCHSSYTLLFLYILSKFSSMMCSVYSQTMANGNNKRKII